MNSVPPGTRCPLLSSGRPPGPRSRRTMKSRFVLATLATFAVGLALAQSPQPATPQPAAAQPAASDALPVPPPPEVTGTAWVLMDAASGNVLAGENYDEQLEPASITKGMTSYVIAAEMAAGKVSRDDQVMMTENAWRT